MATWSARADRNASMDGSSVGLAEVNNSGLTMVKGIELNVDLAKVTSKMEILQALEAFEKLVIESVNLTT